MQRKFQNHIFFFNVNKRITYFSTNALVCGVDEAGRGSVVGPLVIAAVAMSQKAEKEMQLAGVKDSKLLSPSKREALYKLMKSNNEIIFKTAHISAEQIDKRRNNGTNLNELEISYAIRSLNFLKKKLDTANNKKEWSILYLDALSDPILYGKRFEEKFPFCEVVSKHKADSLFTVCGAASIIAKVERDLSIKKIERKLELEIGSGYPSDPRTIHFLKLIIPKDSHSQTQFVRKTWKTLLPIVNK